MSSLYVEMHQLARPLPIAVLTVLLIGNIEEFRAQEVSLKERFLTEAPRKIDEYEKYCHRLQGIVTLTRDIRYKDGKKTHTLNRFEFKQNLHNASFANEFESAEQKWKKLSAINSDYSFELKGRGTDNSWIVTTIAAPDSTLQWTQPLRDVVLNRIMPQYYFEESPLAGILRSSEFIVERADSVPTDGHALVRVTFQYRQQKKPNDPSYCPVQGGSMLLDPDHHWRPLERTLACQWANGSGTVKQKFKYTESGQGFYIIKELRSSDKLTPYGSDSPGSDDVWAYDLREASSLPKDSEFTLSAYGLPEPPQTHRRPTRWYLWASLAGLICLGLAALFRWKTHRAEGPATPPEAEQP